MNRKSYHSNTQLNITEIDGNVFVCYFICRTLTTTKYCHSMEKYKPPLYQFSNRVINTHTNKVDHHLINCLHNFS